MVLIDVIIPVFNASKYILETIGFINSFDFRQSNFNILIVDDGSTDGSSEMVHKHLPKVRIIRTSNQGVSAARNRGFEESTGKYVVFLDSDDLLVGNKIHRQYQLAEETGCDVVYGNWQKLIPDPEGNWIKGEKVERCLSANPDIDLFTNFWCPTGAYLFRRSIVEKVGGFRLDLPVIQDARFALDCALAGAKFVHDPEISCLYRVHKSGSVSTLSRMNFVNDCLNNALQVYQIFIEKGLISSPDYQNSVAQVAHYCAKNLAELGDDKKLDLACELFFKNSLDKKTVLSKKSYWMAKLLGYKRSVIFESKIRSLRKRFSLLK